MTQKQSNLQDAIYKNLQENDTYAYEIRVENKSGSILTTPRTNNTQAFNENIESAKDIAQQEGGSVKVEIYRGKSPKAGKVTEYVIATNDNKENNISSLSQIEEAVGSAIKKYQMNNNMGSLDGINQLLGALTGTEPDSQSSGQSINGMAGLLGIVNNARQENTLMQFEKKLSDYKMETQLSSLQKDLSAITVERDLLKEENAKMGKENSSYKSEVADLENRLAGYSNTEIFKRVATGVISGIGSKLLAGSPKAAELLGLTKDELQSALGVVEEDASSGHSISSETDVDVEELSNPKTEQQKQIFKAIDDTSKALKKGDVNFAYYMITIIGNCMDSQELTNSMVHHLEQEKQRLNLEKDIENNTEEE